MTPLRLLCIAGKGGVGKTTIAAASAAAAARRRRCLVVSLDRAHNLGDILQVQLGPDPVAIPGLPGLSAMELDPQVELSRHWAVIQDYCGRLLRYLGLGGAVAEEMAVLPGLEELLMLSRLAELLAADAFDLVVADFAPTASSLRYLSFPELLHGTLGRWLELDRKAARLLRPLPRRIMPMPVPEEGVYDSIRALAARLDGLRLLLADPERTAALAALLGPGTLLTATPRAQLVGVQVLQLDVDGLREMAVAFPFLFLTGAAFIVAALLFRRVDAERTIIGAMLALGARPAAVLGHYLAFGAVIGLMGSALGSVLGVALGAALTSSYARELAIPFVTTRLDAGVVVIGAALGLVAPTLAGLFPARRAAALAPAAAMRPYIAAIRSRPAAGGRLARLPLWLRLPLRDIGRHPWRSAATAAGVGAALLLIITTAGLLDSTQRGLDLTFGQAERYDLRLDLLLPQPAAQLRRTVAGQPAVASVETLLSLPVQVRPVSGGTTYDTVLQGLPEPSPLLVPLDAAGRPLPPRPGAAVLTRTIAAKIGLRAGDRLAVRLLPNGPSRVVTVGALSDSMVGNALSMPISEVQAAFGLPGAATTALVTAAPGRRQQVDTALSRLPGVAQVTDLQALRAQIGQLMGLLYLFLSVMLLCGVVLAAAILFNTAGLSIAERNRELATMRALGARMGGITRLVTLEHALIALAGLAAGFPVGLIALRLFLRLSSSDLFAMPFWLSARTVLVALLGVALVLLLAQWPALRAVAHMNLADAAKQRE